MNSCSSTSHGNMVGGPCTCGVFHTQSNSFSMLFPKDFDEQEADMYSFTSSSSSSSSSSPVDCTLSLGTPSTRSCESAEKRVHHHDRLIPSFCWDILQSKKHTASSPPTHNKASRGSGGGDSLLARRCANCDTTSTPLWRNGPRGPKSLCNACGIRFKKEERRATATAAAATITTTTASGGAASAIMDSHQRMLNNSSWNQHHHQQSQKMPCFSPAIGNEFRFINADSDRDIDTSIPFLSWHRNITDRPSLVHGFTR
ncbi:unnamed protein product [Camellia sinensis]